jgi:hypothetical protein
MRVQENIEENARSVLVLKPINMAKEECIAYRADTPGGRLGNTIGETSVGSRVTS